MGTVLAVDTTSQTSTLPDLRGQVCLLADASGPVGNAVHRELRDAGAEVIALHHDGRSRHEPQPFRAGLDTLAALVDLGDAREVADALTWALSRTQRIDLAVVTSQPGGLALATLTARQLGLTSHFQPDRVPVLLYLAPPAEQAVTRLESALEEATVFAEPIEVVVVDAWPDTPRSTISAVQQLLASPRVTTASISCFDPMLGRQLIA